MNISPANVTLLLNLLATILLVSCTKEMPDSPPLMQPRTQTATAVRTIAPPTKTLVLKQQTQTPNLTVITTPSTTISASVTPDTRLAPRYWREWPVVPLFSIRSQNILKEAKNNPEITLYRFSKVGDCQMTSDTFLGGYARNQYPIPSGLDGTVAWFGTSMTSESITAYNGLGINSILNPMFGYAAGNKECERQETPLSCELRLNRPVVVLIGMGTNWKPDAEVSFEKYLRQVVDEILMTGALPVLSTKADNVEENWKINESIAKVAYDYDLPLVNVWRSVQDLPNHGLELPPKQVYLTPEGWMRRNEAWLRTLHTVYQVLHRPKP